MPSQIKLQRNNIKKLNKKQQEAYDYLSSGKSVFLTGPAGVGKTLIIKRFRRDFESMRNIAITSTTGTSALLLNGSTLHSYLGIGCGTDMIENLIYRIESRRWIKKRWKELECLLIDEISMLDPDLFDKLEQIARVIRKNSFPFGGIQLVLSGDFLQLPVIGTDRFCFQAESWNMCIENNIHLDEIIRQGDVEFKDILNKIRVGYIDDDIKRVLNSRIGVNLENSFGIRPTKLYSKNIDVNKENELELDKLANDGRQFYEYDIQVSVYVKQNQNIVREKFLKNSNISQNLQLCEGAQVMLTKNLDLINGLANGSRGVITSFVNDLPIVKFLNGEERLIELSIWDIEENGELILSARQIPIKIAYAISIHKSQGCSLDYAEIDLSEIFEYGQAYVALSRVKSLKGLSLIDINYDLIAAHPIAVEFYESLKKI